MRLVFLGTGSPTPEADRYGIATLIEAGPHRLLFDTGRATVQRLHDCGIPIADVTTVFYTHLHSDHVCGFADLWMTGWFVSGRTAPLELFGPPGTQQFAYGMRIAHHFDLAVRPEYEAIAASGLALQVTEFEAGIVFNRDGVTVRAFHVDHGPHVTPAFGFRIDYAGCSIVLSGDTTGCDELVRQAAGADVLVNEIWAASDGAIARNPAIPGIIAIHTNPEQMADMARRAQPRAVFFNHISLRDVSQAEVIARVQEDYAGTVTFAHDCMDVLVGEEIRIVSRQLAAT